MKIGMQGPNDRLMKFEKIIENLLFLEDDPGALRETACAFYEILTKTTGVGGDSELEADGIATILKSGKAISPTDAARCVLDFTRTTKFIRGIHSAILDLKQKFPGEKIEILYAGCGPFAPLVLPHCAMFGPEEVSVTLIDVHERSIESTKKVFERFGFRDHVCELITADASLYRAVGGKKFHLIITETMQKTLEKEPQVDITLNLSNQLRENGIFIPQKITITACLANIQNEFLKGFARQRILLGTIFELSADSKDILKPRTIEMPNVDTAGMSLMLLTNILVFGNYRLEDYQSGITYATILHDLPGSEPGDKIEFHYVPGENPGFKYKRL